MANDPALENHREWLGYLKPVGLVVSPPALVEAGVLIDRSSGARVQHDLKSLLVEKLDDTVRLPRENFEKLFFDLLEWRESDLVCSESSDCDVKLALPDYNAVLAPTHIVKFDSESDKPDIFLKFLDENTEFDSVDSRDGGWDATHHFKFVRLLNEKDVPTGIMVSESGLRLIYAPKGESSGYITFPFDVMAEVAGRGAASAFKLLLDENRVFAAPTKERLPTLLEESRKYQNTVSTQLAKQVLGALYELLRGLQAGNERRDGELLKDLLKESPNKIYHGCITVLMRIVFLLFAEDRDLVPTSKVYLEGYSVTGLFDKLREDSAAHPDVMDQRYGAWAQFLSLFRLLYDGANAPGLKLPVRHGHLFDPDRFLFLEGKINPDDKYDPPLIPDGVVFNILCNLMYIGGDRISYRALDVEQIGSVYEAIMGFSLEEATGPSLAIKPKKSHGAPVVLDLQKLLDTEPSKRAKYFKSNTDQDFSGAGLKNANSIEELEAALTRKIERTATPRIVPKGSLILQPSDERRRSGSHYTPRSLTEPIVRKALEPILKELGDSPTPDQILDLKICDSAMGSAAFLVEATRQLSEHLVLAWETHDLKPSLSPDEDELLHARRLVVQRCIYGVDKNPMAVDLAKLSLWLATFAHEHSFTFLDHALKTGDSLVGLSIKQISSLTWDDTPQSGILMDQTIQTLMKEYLGIRRGIRSAKDSESYDELEELNKQAEGALANVRYVADMIISCWFSETSDRARRAKLAEVGVAATNLIAANAMPTSARALPKGLSSFHWELEFPEVFERDNSGFDSIIGNPPFLGGMRISGSYGPMYLKWLHQMNPGTEHRCDLVAYFFRKAYGLMRKKGTFGLIATNTIAQGDTREGGLTRIVNFGASIYCADRRFKWPGNAQVVVSIVHVIKQSPFEGPRRLDSHSVGQITSFLFERGPNNSPAPLRGRKKLHSQGSIIFGSGFLFDDNDSDANPSSLIDQLTSKDSSLASRIRPYFSGEDVNDSPAHEPRRSVIYLSDLKTEDEVASIGPLYEIVKLKVKPQRDSLPERPSNLPLIRKWWAYQAHRPLVYEKLSSMKRVIVISQIGKNFAFTLIPTGGVIANTLIIILKEEFKYFSLLQSRVHEVWSRFLGSSMKDDLRYTPSDCFETFPFPENYESIPLLEQVGELYFGFRAALMIKNGEGLTKTYNRFHDPNEDSKEILKMRDLHTAMDRAVLDAYGWSDVLTDCEFLLDYEVDEDEGGGATNRRRRLPWKYRWPDEVRDEVLARLLDLNQKRAAEEKLAGKDIS